MRRQPRNNLTGPPRPSVQADTQRTTRTQAGFLRYHLLRTRPPLGRRRAEPSITEVRLWQTMARRM